jgi:rhamnulokinase
VIEMPDPVSDRRALVAVDLGAESCRVSLLQWDCDEPRIRLLHRIPNGPVEHDGKLRWPLERILAGVDEGLRKAAAAAPEGIRSIAVDGWAVDYLRLDSDGRAVEAPFCYRDERTVAAKAAADALISADEIFASTGAQPLRINTVYQLVADAQAGMDARISWILLPEYVLYRLGGRRVAEYTNATHTGLVDIETGDWSRPVFERLGLAMEAASPIVPAGTIIGKVCGELASLPAFADTVLIAPACHDTASAIAAIAGEMEHAAYIVSGTWSLVGTVVEKPVTSAEAMLAGFTNQGAAAGGYCFHTNVNGMWLVKQCMDAWCEQGRGIDLPTLISESAKLDSIPGLIDVSAPDLLLSGEMPARVNRELESRGCAQISDEAGNEAVFARVIFASLASRYADVIRHLESLTHRSFKSITVLGGGSRNSLLNQLTEETTGLPVSVGEAEGSTLGNFAVQLAAGNSGRTSPELVQMWAKRLTGANILSR